MAKKKLTTTKKIIIIGALLVALQGLYLTFFGLGGSGTPTSIREAMDQAVDAQPGISSERRSRVKLQIALSDYRAKNQMYPESLNRLIPEYFDSVPIDPETALPFKYSVQKDRYLLGEASNSGKSSVTAAAKPGQKSIVAADEETALIATLDDTAEVDAYVYDSADKKDPFRSFNFAPREIKSGATPLEKFTYDDIKLTAVLKGMDEPRAIIEDADGRGHTVGIGTKVGIYGGEIMRIEEDHLVILETTVEFTGEKSTRTVEMFLRRGGD